MRSATKKPRASRFQAALTGHLVLATLHTNDAPGAVSRLLDMNIEPYLLSGALVGVVAQRLARKVCPACATKYHPEPALLGEAGLMDKVGRAFSHGTGCRECHDTGFKGRLGIYEVMEVTPKLRRMIHRGAAAHQLRETARAEGRPTTLSEEGAELALSGSTSLEEDPAGDAERGRLWWMTTPAPTDATDDQTPRKEAA